MHIYNILLLIITIFTYPALLTLNYNYNFGVGGSYHALNYNYNGAVLCSLLKLLSPRYNGNICNIASSLLSVKISMITEHEPLKILLANIKYSIKEFFILNDSLIRTGLLPLLVLIDNPETYYLTFNGSLIAISCLVLLVIFLTFFKEDIKSLIFAFLHYMYNFKIIKKIVNYYLFALVVWKGLFEIEYYLLPFIFILPNCIFIFDVITKTYPYLDNPLFLAAFYLSIGVLFISIDEIVSTFVNLVEKNPSHFLATNYLLWVEENKKIIHYTKDFYYRGFFTGAGKLSAAGQAAVYTGIFALGTGVVILL